MLDSPTITDPDMAPDNHQEGQGQIDPLLLRLAAMSLKELRLCWRKAFGTPPAIRSAGLLRLNLAWRLQAKTEGGMSIEDRRRLQRSGPIVAEGLELGAGTKLIRQWQGINYEVIVEENGFRWQGEIYASLSAIASVITGTRWNGPRFFGLRKGG